MTPQELLAIVAVIAVTRVVLSLRPVVAGSSGRSTAVAREFLDPFIIAGLAAWVLITFVARTYYIPSGSMLPTLQIHDVLLVDKFEYRFRPPHRGDIVVFPPPVPTPDDFIKRVVGLPGDRLNVSGGRVYVNGTPLAEPYVAEKPDYGSADPATTASTFAKAHGWEKLDSASANVPPRSMWTTPIHPRRTATCCSATTATIRKIRTCGDSRKMRAVLPPARAPAKVPVLPAARS